MNINFNIKEVGIAILACSSVFYVVKFDSLHKIPGISTLANAMMGHPRIESLVLGLLLGMWAVLAFLPMRQYFSRLHGWNEQPAKAMQDIVNAAQKRISAYEFVMLPVGAGLTCFFGAIALVGLIQLKLGVVFPNLYIKDNDHLAISFARHVLFSPLIETMVGVIFLEVGRRLLTNNLLIVILSAFFWGLLHASLEPINFFATAWIFFVISDLYIAVRESTSISKASVSMLAAHFLNNLLAFGVVLIRM